MVRPQTSSFAACMPCKTGVPAHSPEECHLQGIDTWAEASGLSCRGFARSAQCTG